VTQENREAAAAAIVEGERAVSNLAGLHVRLGPCFGRVEPFRQAHKYITALMSDLPRKNGWTIAEHAGDSTPDRTQRLLNHAVWDTDEAMAVVRGFVTEHLVDELVVGALDESGQQKQGEHTAGAKRQYMGCAGRIANGVNTVYCTYATSRGHALVGARIWVPAEHLDDEARRAVSGIPKDVRFKTKPQLAKDIVADMAADHTMPPWFAGDEVYGRSGELRGYIETQGSGYVLRAGCDFLVEMTPGTRERADALVDMHLTMKKHRKRWQVCSVPGSKGARRYAWAWLGTAGENHYLLIRKHLTTGELAYHYCYVPPGRRVTLMTLVRVACLRWPVEEDFEFSKDHFGLDHGQVRRYSALLRHIVLTMAALAVCAVTAAQAKTPGSPRILPTRPDQEPPADTGLIAPTVAEIKRLFNLITRRLHTVEHHLHWAWWRRRHQARARWFHHRTRLRRDDQTA
jgi:SRSO17 transposase